MGIGIPGPTLDGATRAHLEALRPGAVILFARNILDVAQTRALIAELRAQLHDVLLLVDQEGGTVIRFARALTVLPGAMALGAAGDSTLARAAGRVAAAELRAVGFDLNLAPVCDLASDPENPGLGLRAFAADPGVAAAMAAAFVAGAREGGGATCAKHFPGLGAARVDPHLGMPSVGVSAAELAGAHAEPFRAAIAARVDAVMTAHAVYSQVAPGQPAPFARSIVTGLLRGELGFDGVVISDDLEMGALAGCDPADAAVRAMQAGHDLVLVCHSPERQRAAAEALGTAMIEGRIAPDVARAASERLAALAAQGAAARHADWPAADDGSVVASTIAERSIAWVGAGAPPAADGPLVAIVPTFAELTQVEGACADVAGAAGGLADALRAVGLDAAVHAVPLDPDAAAVEQARAACGGAARVLVATFDAARHPGQQALLRSLAGVARERLVVAHLRNPFDARFVPDGVPQLQPWGFRPVHLRALAAVLAGQVDAHRLPGLTP